ncbi:hypothetical protein ABPG72_014409 [Tetrahymena utriculariae]
MSEDQNTTNSCLNCKSQFKRDRICISKQCSDQEYLKYICKMCHYEEHKSQGRLKLSELEIDIFKKDIEDLIETQMNQDQEEQKLYNNSKLIREKIKESIKCLENFDKQLEEFENEYITLHEKLKKAFNGLKKQDNEELQQSIYNIFERVQLCESDDNSKTVGFWKIQRSCQEDKLVQVRQICEISNYLNRFTQLEKIDSISQEIININKIIEDQQQLNQQFSDCQKKINLLNTQNKKFQIINECNKLVQKITSYFINWFDFEYIQIERLTCTQCQSFFYILKNKYYQQYDSSSSDVCNNCMPQYRQNRDPEGTSIFYYYSHEKSSTWIKTRNAQDIYNYYQKMLGTINENNQQLNNYAKSQDTK